MIDKIKSFFGYIAAALAGLVGILAFILHLKNKKLVGLEAKVELAKTEEEVTKLQNEIIDRLLTKELARQEIKELNKALLELEIKKQELKKQKLNPEQVEEYWSNKN